MNSNIELESIWLSSELDDKIQVILSGVRAIQFEPVFEFWQKDYQDQIEAKFGITEIRIIGGGSFGSVYTGVQNESEEVVSFKAISATNTKLLSMMTFCKKAKNEIGIMQMLKHDNIIKYYDHLKILQQHYMVPIRYLIKMERLDVTLEKAISRNLFNEKQCLQVFLQIGSALEYMHCEMKIAHHDLKPNNIMMKMDDNFEECIFKIIDFGLSKVYSTEIEETCDKAFRGTALFMAPEKSKRPCIYNPFLSDSFAFGYCLLISIIGNDKFESLWMDHLGKIPENIVHNYVRNEPISSALESLISLNPENRLFVRDALKILS